MKKEINGLRLNKKTIANLGLTMSNNYAGNTQGNNCGNTPSDTGCGTYQGHTCNNANTCGFYTCRCTKKC